jgi:AcrR family transcriptional regulator
MDKDRKRAQLKDAGETRLRILDAAKRHFAGTSYEAVGIREIAADAGVDAALVMRYFGSKEKLFTRIAAEAFSFEKLIADKTKSFAIRILDLLFLPANQESWRGGYDPFRLLLSSIGSNTAGPIISSAFKQAFVQQLSASLSGKGKKPRAVLISSYILGVALLRITEPNETFTGASGNLIRAKLQTALNECINP